MQGQHLSRTLLQEWSSIDIESCRAYCCQHCRWPVDIYSLQLPHDILGRHGTPHLPALQH